MVRQLKNIVIVLLAAVFVFAGKTNAQPDTIPENYFTSFQQNINQLSASYYISDPDFYPGKFSFKLVENFSEKYQSLDFSCFQKVWEESEEYFHFFDSLSENDKNNLIRLFSFYEKDFETELKKAGLPSELKYLPPALSAMYPFAVVHGSRAGVWQLAHF